MNLADTKERIRTHARTHAKTRDKQLLFRHSCKITLLLLLLL